MYKQKKKNRLERSKHPLLWIWKKIILIIVAAMMGMSNAIDEEDKTIHGNQHYAEQKD